MEVILDEEEVEIDTVPLATKSPITAALIDVNAAQLKLKLLENFNESYSKCLRLLMFQKPKCRPLSSCMLLFISAIKINPIIGEMLSFVGSSVDTQGLLCCQSLMLDTCASLLSESNAKSPFLCAFSTSVAATTASSLEAEQDSGNITKTRSNETPNVSSSLGTTSGGGPWCQETTGDTIAQTRICLCTQDLAKKIWIKILHTCDAPKIMLKPGEFELWRMRIEQYIQMIDYALWEVIENGATLPKTVVVEGVEKVMPITSAEDKAQRRLGDNNQVKARKKRFGGNAATKKTQESTKSKQHENSCYKLRDGLIKFVRLSNSFQPNSPQLAHEDLQQIHPDDIEEMDLLA
ncbi:hypothetical protein Tco_0912993 [Tanacetum coccineum]